MTRNYFKSAWRSLVFNKQYTAINIVGLSVSIAACILIGVSVHHETSFDSQVPDRSNVYRLNEYVHYDGTAPQLSAAIGPPIAALLKSSHSEIEMSTRVYSASPEIFQAATLEYNGKKVSSGKLICTDSSFARMFGIQIISGNHYDFIPLQNNIAFTQSMAQKIFGQENALNKTIALRVNDSTAHQYVVSHIIKDLPGTSHLQADIMLRIPADFEKGFLGKNYGVLLGPTYLRLQAGVDSKKLEAKLTETVHAKNKFIDMRLQPVAELHAGSTDISYDFLYGDRKSVV